MGSVITHSGHRVQWQEPLYDCHLAFSYGMLTFFLLTFSPKEANCEIWRFNIWILETQVRQWHFSNDEWKTISAPTQDTFTSTTLSHEDNVSIVLLFKAALTYLWC